MFNARWVDEQHKEKSRYVVKDFANTRDPTMFAAASDTVVGRVVEVKAVLQNYSMFTFDVTSAYTHASEDELVFLEPPPEEIEGHGEWCGRSERTYGRRKGARSWQEHFDSILRSAEARQRGFTVESHPKCPTLYHPGQNDYMRNSLINSKPKVPQSITYRKMLRYMLHFHRKLKQLLFFIWRDHTTQTTHTTQNTHTTQTTHTNTQQHTETETETDRDRERRQGQREKRRRKRRDKTREEKTKQNKTRQDKYKTREERRFIFSVVVVHGLFFLLM